MKKTISEQAKEFRLSKNWSPTEMARHVGCNRQDINNLEANPNRMPHYVDDLARVMGCTAGELLSGTCLDAVKPAPQISQHSLEETLKNLSDYIASLDQQDRIDAMHLIERLAESPERYAKTAAAIEAMRDAPFTHAKQA